MSSALDITRRARGKILRVVKRYIPDGVTIEGLERVFSQAGQFGIMERLHEHVDYLAGPGKEYLTCSKLEFEDQKRVIVKLTPKGIDLLDGILDPDPGVEVVC